MNEVLEKTINALGVKHFESFQIEGKPKTFYFTYDDLITEENGKLSVTDDEIIINLFMGKLKINKYPYISDESKNILRCLKALGFNYVVRKCNNKFIALTHNPEEKVNLYSESLNLTSRDICFDFMVRKDLDIFYIDL